MVVVGALTAGLGRQQAAGRHKSFRPLRRVGSSILLRPDKRKEEAGEGGRKGEERTGGRGAGRAAREHREGGREAEAEEEGE